MVEHCGGRKQNGDFVHTLVLTDIATGWTECVALPVREQTLVVEGFAKASAELPFRVLGLDTDNDSAFMNQTVLDYCAAHRIEFTRSRAYKKNDQAWVEQKNGAIVRRLVGYGRLSGLEATRTLANLYTNSRLYVNFFQPSFKLKSKIRDGAQVKKTYHHPLTPYERLLGAKTLTAKAKQRLREQFMQLDPVLLLSKIRTAQQQLVDLLPDNGRDGVALGSNVKTFLAGLSTAWKAGEARPTHRKNQRPSRWWRTRIDPFEHTWPTVQAWLESEPGVSAQELMRRLAGMFPELYIGTAQRRTLQRRVRVWRQERAKELIFGSLTQFSADQERERPRPPPLDRSRNDIYDRSNILR